LDKSVKRHSHETSFITGTQEGKEAKRKRRKRGNKKEWKDRRKIEERARGGRKE